MLDNFNKFKQFLEELLQKTHNNKNKKNTDERCKSTLCLHIFEFLTILGKYVA